MKKFIIAVILFFALTLNLLPSNLTFAKENFINFDNTSVLNDLKDFEIVNSDKVRVITVAEYCFGPTKIECSNYGLYIYVQNPSKEELNVSNGSNVVNMAVNYENNEPNIYANLSLKFLNCSNDYYLYKFKVEDVNEMVLNNALSQNTFYAKRRYDISSIQLTYLNGLVVDSLVGGTYIFSGYGEGVTNVNAPLTFEQFDTIQLNVKDTYYRTPSSDKGKNYQNQISSVYFSVPNEYLEKYKTLTEVACEWYEYKTPYITVLSNEDKYNAIYPYLGVEIGEHTDNISIDLRSEDFNHIPNMSTGGGVIHYDWTYNMPYYSNDFSGLYISSEVYCNALYYLFNTNGKSASEYVVSSEELKNYIYNYDKVSKGLENVAGKQYASELLSGQVEDYRTRGYNRKVISNKDMQPVGSYNDTHGFWETANDYGFWNALIGANVPKDESFSYDLLHQVKSEEVLSNSVSSDLLVAPSDVEEFINYCNVADSENKTTFLLRFAKTDYLAFNLTNNDGYVAQESLFLNFDIIQLKFGLGENSKIVPVCSSPIDIITEITPPVDFETDLKWLIFSAVVIGFCLTGILIISIINEN